MPMQICNVNECGVLVVHKAGEKGKRHTIASCVSASGSTLPCFLIYPRKRLTDNLKEGAYLEQASTAVTVVG